YSDAQPCVAHVLHTRTRGSLVNGGERSAAPATGGGGDVGRTELRPRCQSGPVNTENEPFLHQRERSKSRLTGGCGVSGEAQLGSPPLHRLDAEFDVLF